MITPSKLIIFLPVYNRGSKTKSFLDHVVNILPYHIEYQVFILDDQSTDDSISHVQSFYPNVNVIKMDGDSFWGGSLNFIRNYIMNYDPPKSHNYLYLLANDDIRYLNSHSLAQAIDAVNDSTIVCAWGTSIPKNLNTTITPINSSKSIYYNRLSGSFSTLRSSVSCISLYSTWSMLATHQAWLSAPMIPNSIPHYLSDYWLLQMMQELGFSIRVLPDFGVFVHDSVESNKCTFSLSGFITKFSLKQSFYYLPAHIQFLNDFSPPVLRIQLRKFLLYCLFRFSQFINVLYRSTDRIFS